MVVYCDFCKKYSINFFPEDKAEYAIFNEEGILEVLLCKTHFLATKNILEKEGKHYKRWN